MSQTGYTPILIYSSTTASQAPAAGNLTNSTLGSELAINITDGKLFYKDNANAVQVIGWKTTPTTAGGTGLTSYTAGDLIYYASGTTFTKLGIGTAYYQLGVNAGGTAPAWQPSATSVMTDQGDLLYASAANTLARLAKNTTATRYLSNTGTSNNPAWAQINLANGVTDVLPVANGGTNASSASITAFNNITGYSASGATGTTSTNLVFSAVPTFGTTIGVGGATASASGAGVSFPASQSASTDANTLDDYEEGTFTPNLTNNGTITYTAQYGRYTKIGRQVHLFWYINVNTVSGGNGVASMTAPFSADAVATGAFSYVGTNGVNTTGQTGTNSPAFYASNTTIYHYDISGGILFGANVTAGCLLIGSMTYFTS